jgi:hypothetical protein
MSLRPRRGANVAGEVFSGSYLPEDVCFLLRPVFHAETPLAEKETLLQSGARHYSEIIGPEHTPSDAYLAAYEAALRANGDRLADDIRCLAAHIARSHADPVCLVSLARAGTPIGVLLRRALLQFHGRHARHASISIIADRGLDTVALDIIREEWDIPDRGIVFIDGWTGKGVIARELRRAIEGYNRDRGASLSPHLHVVADLCGSAPVAATTDDYLIPSCLLGATVSGLVSRSILNDTVVRPGEVHACRFYAELAPNDRTRSFVDDITHRMMRLARQARPTELPARDHGAEAARAADAIERWSRTLGSSSARLVKPGLGEATRVLLRRVPGDLVVRDADAEQLRPTLLLAREKNVPVRVDPSLPWAALACIQETQP